MSQVQVFIIGSVPIVVTGLVTVLESEKNINVLKCLDTFENALIYIKNKLPDVIIIDDSFYDKRDVKDFVDTLLKSPAGKRLIVYTETNDSDYLLNLANRGVRGILHRTATKEKVIEAVNLISWGGAFFDSLINFIITKEDIKEKIQSNNPFELLTKREKEVLTLISLGKKNKEIAKALFISCGTVEVHKANLLKKLSLKSTNELIIFAVSQKEK